MSSAEKMSKLAKIMIIDDQQDILDLMNDLLTPEGYRVTALKQVEDIFLEIEKNEPDIILIDFLLAGINGGELCAQIKKNPKTGHIPVIFLSAHSRVLESLGHYGYDDFIAKPFDIKDVLATIERHLLSGVRT